MPAFHMHIAAVDAIQNLLHDLHDDGADFTVLKDTVVVDHPDSDVAWHISIPGVNT